MVSPHWVLIQRLRPLLREKILPKFSRSFEMCLSYLYCVAVLEEFMEARVWFLWSTFVHMKCFWKTVGEAVFSVFKVVEFCDEATTHYVVSADADGVASVDADLLRAMMQWVCIHRSLVNCPLTDVSFAFRLKLASTWNLKQKKKKTQPLHLTHYVPNDRPLLQY